MSLDESPDSTGRRRRLGLAAGLLTAGAIGGAVLSTTLPASAASTTMTPSPAATASRPGSGSAERGSMPTGAPDADGSHMRPNGVGGQRADEKVLTGTLADQATAAALKAVPGATIIRVETDADGVVYEAHLKKPDGSLVTVKFDKNLAVTGIQAGMGSMRQPTTTSGPA
jgi:hypothetical protein